MNATQSHATHTPNSPEPQEWEDAKQKIHQLWVTEGLSLAAVKERMEVDHNHVASYRIYKDYFARWGFRKNTSKRDWQAFTILRDRAKFAGFELCQVKIHNRTRRSSELQSYLRKRKMSETDLLNEAIESGASVPDHVQWLAGSIASKEQCAALKGLANTVEHSCRICASEISTSIQGAEMVLPGSGFRSVEESSTHSGGNSFEDHQFQHPHCSGNPTGSHRQTSQEQDFDAPLYTPVAGTVRYTVGRYDQTEKHHAFMGDIFMACMSGAGGNLVFQGLCLGQAIIKLGEMIAAQDPLLLVTIHMVLVWLQVHVASSLPESLIRALSHATTQSLGKGSLIATILESMTAAAGKKLPSGHVDSVMLRQAVRKFSETLGPGHPHTLVSRYYMCFHILRVDCRSKEARAKLLAEVEEELQKLYHDTSKILGSSNFLAVCVLATLSRAQSRQGEHHAAFEMIDRSIQEAPLGLNHPHRLSLLSRQALICGHLKDKLKEEERAERMYWDNKMEDLYWIVVRGRAATLGRYHEHTQKAHETLVEILKENGRWESMKGKAQELLANPSVAVNPYESWWQSMVPKDREGEVQRASSEEMD